MDGVSFADALASRTRAFASPAIIAFIGYVVLACMGRVQTNTSRFGLVTGLFIVFQVFYDDYLRIILIRRAEGEKQP